MCNARYAMQCKICNARSAMQVLGYKLWAANFRLQTLGWVNLIAGEFSAGSMPGNFNAVYMLVVSYHVTSFRILSYQIVTNLILN